MCGENPECHTAIQDIEIRQDGVDECDKFKCSWDTKTSSCKLRRGSEACEKITNYYNPLYLEKEVDSSTTPLDRACDDEKGKHLGTYQCLGKVHIMSYIYLFY